MTKEKENHRTQLLRKNIIVSFLAKGWSALVLLLTVPVTLNCLGEYTNGVWLTISSLLLWIDNMDIGLGNGLRNKLAKYLAHDDTLHARRLVSSAFAMLFCIMIPCMVILCALTLLGDTYGFLNVMPQKILHLDSVLIVTIILVCTTFIFKLTGNVYMGLQLPAVNNLLVASGQTLALIGTYLVYLLDGHSLLHIALVNTMAPFLVYLAAYPITFYYKYPSLRPTRKLVRFSEAKELMTIGLRFFVLQISGVVLFMSSNILISKLFNPAMVTPYQITYRYFFLLQAIFTVICTPYWNATTDAYERNDMLWVKNASKKLDLMVLLILVCAILMIVFSNVIYAIWIGSDIIIDIRLSVLMAVYHLILIYSMRYSYMLNGFGKLRLQLITTITAAVLFIPLSCAVVAWKHDLVCFLGVMSLVNIPGLIVNRIQLKKIINGTATGIWNQS